jgi:GT2 family glycosyltransferase
MSKRNKQRSIAPNKKPTNLLDICILTSGCVDLFEKCLDAVMKQYKDVSSRIYVLINCPPDDTVSKYNEIIKKLPSNAVVTRYTGEMPVGFPTAANKVMKSGTSPLILFVSDDVILHPNCINTLIRRMDDPAIGLCGLKLLFPDTSTDPGRPAGKVQHVGHVMNIRGEIEHVFMGWDATHPKTCISRECFSVTGASFIVRRNLFMKAHGFYEGYGRGTYEDVDLAITIRTLGSKVYIDTDATAYHYVGATVKLLKHGFPLQNNRIILQQRHLNRFIWDSWSVW